MRGIAFLPLRIRALDHLESALGIVQPHGYRTLIDEPRPYFEFPRSAFMHRVTLHDVRRFGKRFGPDHNQAVALPRLFVIRSVWAAANMTPCFSSAT